MELAFAFALLAACFVPAVALYHVGEEQLSIRAMFLYITLECIALAIIALGITHQQIGHVLGNWHA